MTFLRIDTHRELHVNHGMVPSAPQILTFHLSCRIPWNRPRLARNKAVGLGVEVQVTQHQGSDSDKWLLH